MRSPRVCRLPPFLPSRRVCNSQKTIPPNTELTISYGPESSLWFNPIYPDPLASPSPRPASPSGSATPSDVDHFEALLSIDESMIDQKPFGASGSSTERKTDRPPKAPREKRVRRNGRARPSNPTSDEGSSGDCGPAFNADETLPPVPGHAASSSRLDPSSSASSSRSPSVASSITPEHQKPTPLVHPPSDPGVTLPTLPPPLCKPSASSIMTRPVSIPPLIPDPADLDPNHPSLEEIVPWDALPFLVVQADGALSELEMRQEEERETGWRTMEIWAVDVADGGKITATVLEALKQVRLRAEADALATGSDVSAASNKYGDGRMKHLKRVMKSSEALADKGCAFPAACPLHDSRRADISWQPTSSRSIPPTT